MAFHRTAAFLIWHRVTVSPLTGPPGQKASASELCVFDLCRFEKPGARVRAFKVLTWCSTEMEEDVGRVVAAVYERLSQCHSEADGVR